MEILAAIFLFCLLAIFMRSGQVNQAQEPWEDAVDAIQDWNSKHERR